MVHELFDLDSVKAWIASKIELDASRDCKVRAILLDEYLAGWCEIQRADEKYEIAMVIYQ